MIIENVFVCESLLQLYRFAIRCSEMHFFQVAAAAKLMMDMTRHGYANDRVRRHVQNLRKIYFQKPPMKPTIFLCIVLDPVARDKNWWLVNDEIWTCIEREGQAPYHGRLLGDEWVRPCTFPDILRTID